jgi:acetolactate synthase I/II/III large subunit
MPTTGEACIRLLEQYGTDTVFGIPGVHTLEMYRGLEGSPIRHVTPRHEQGAAFMADAYARVSGKPGVCLLITGAGLTNAATGIASAYHDSIPVLVLSSAPHTRDARKGHGSLHDLPDQQALMRTITAESIEVEDPAQLPEAFARAWEIFETRRPRPVHIAVPIDVLELAAASTDRLPPRGSVPVADPGAVTAAARLLEQAERPMIILGGGAVRAGAEARAVAARAGAPIGTTINGKGAVPDDDPLSLGASLTLQPVYEALEGADVVLAAGTEFSETDYFYSDSLRLPAFRGALIRLDIDEHQLRQQVEPAVELHGDARATLAALAAAMDGDRSEDAARRVAELRGGVRWWRGADAFTPFLAALRTAVPRNAILCADSTQPAYVAHHYWPGYTPHDYIAPGGFGTLGPAVPMAIGARLASGDRPVAALVGDGGSLFTIPELAAAVDAGVPVAIVLWQNHGYGEIRYWMDRTGVAPIGTDTTARDFLRLAEGLGCHAVRAGTLDELPEILTAAFAADRPTLVEVPAAAH